MYKVSGQKSPRGRVGEQKKYNSRENRGKIAKIAYPYSSVIIVGTLRKLSWQIGLMMPYKHTKFQVESRRGAGLVSKRNTNREKIAKKLRENHEKSQRNSNCEKIISERGAGQGLARTGAERGHRSTRP